MDHPGPVYRTGNLWTGIDKPPGVNVGNLHCNWCNRGHPNFIHCCSIQVDPVPECLSLNPRKFQPTMLIKNNEGDWAMLKGRWQDFRSGMKISFKSI